MGSGKSTLLSLLAGLTTPDAGTIRIGGEPLRGIRRDAAFVFQNYSLLPWLTRSRTSGWPWGAAFPELTRDQQRARAQQTLEGVGLGNALAVARAAVGRHATACGDRQGAGDGSAGHVSRRTARRTRCTHAGIAAGELARLCGEGMGASRPS
jgi:ABC-type taurine transport system ATPase subunit